MPGSSWEALEKWRLSADVVSEFLSAACILEQVDSQWTWTTAAQLYQFFRRWSQNNGFQQVNSKNFGVRLRKLGVKRKRTKEGRIYRVALREDVVKATRRFL